MTEDAFVDTHVREFAAHINCDRQLAQDLFFQHKVSLALDNEQKSSVRQELEAMHKISKTLDKAAKAVSRIPKECDQLQKTLKLQGLDLQKQVSELNDTLKHHVDFFTASFIDETRRTSSYHKANTIAEFVTSAVTVPARAT